MKASHLKALEHLPKVIEALQAIALESEKLRGLMQRAGMASSVEQAPPAPKSIAVDDSPLKAERRAWLETQRGVREEKLAQFKRPTEDEDYAAAMAEEAAVKHG